MREWSAFSSIVLAGMLLVTGLGIGITGVRDIVKSTSGGTIAIPGTLALIAAVVSIVTKEWMSGTQEVLRRRSIPEH